MQDHAITVLRTLQEKGELTQKEISHETGLYLVKISRDLRDLYKDSLVTFDPLSKKYKASEKSEEALLYHYLVNYISESSKEERATDLHSIPPFALVSSEYPEVFKSITRNEDIRKCIRTLLQLIYEVYAKELSKPEINAKFYEINGERTRPAPKFLFLMPSPVLKMVFNLENETEDEDPEVTKWRKLVLKQAEEIEDAGGIAEWGAKEKTKMRKKSRTDG